MAKRTAALKEAWRRGGTRVGGEIDSLAEASGAVLAAQWGEAAEEHGGGVGGDGGLVTCVWCVGRMGKITPAGIKK